MVTLTKEQLAIKKANVLLILKSFVSFCNLHSLKYYAAYGTVLGAARHQGFIPWDDDIDVYMPRPDYDKFLNLAKKQPPKGYDVMDHRFDRNYYSSYAKFCDANTTILEDETLRTCLGNFIDVFPLDGLPEDTKERYNYCQKLEKDRLMLASVSFHKSFSTILREVKDLHLRTALISIRNEIFRDDILNHIETDFSTLFAKYSYENSTFLGYAASVCKKEWNLKRNIFGEGKLLPFEDIQIRVPSKYEEYLESIYGNWKKYPPKEEQHPQHFIAYINLKERISYEKVIKIINNKNA